jgi:hypothetical protein
MSGVDYSKISDATLEKLVNKEKLDFSVLPDDELEEVVKYLNANKKTKVATPELESTSKMESFLRSAAQAASFEFADEITAKAESLLTGKDYDQALAESRANYKKAYEDNPLISVAGSLVGSVAVPVPFLGLAKGGGTVLQAARRAAAAGGVAGALQGAGESEGATASEVAKDAIAGGALGATIAPVLGGAVTAAPKFVKSAMESGKLGRSITQAFEAGEESAVKKAKALREAKAAGASDEVIKQIDSQPLFGTPEYYKIKRSELMDDSQKFVEDLVGGLKKGSDVVSVPEYTNTLYAKVRQASKEDNVKLETKAVLDALKVYGGMSGEELRRVAPRIADEIERVMQDTLNITGFKIEKVPNTKVLQKQVEIAKEKMESKILAQQAKIKAEAKNQAIKKAQTAIDSLDKDPMSVVNNLSDAFVESNRVKLHTQAINVANQEAQDVVARLTDPMRFVDEASDVPIEVQFQKIKNDAERVLKSVLPEEALFDTPQNIIKNFSSKKSKKLIDDINDRISATAKLVDTIDPKTGRTVFTASFENPFTGDIVAKPISVKSELQPFIGANKVAPKKGSEEYSKAVANLANQIMEENDEVLKYISVNRGLETTPGASAFTAEVVNPLNLKTSIVTQPLPQGVTFENKMVPVEGPLDPVKLDQLKMLSSKMLKEKDLSLETKAALLRLKNLVSGKISESPKVEEAAAKADEFRRFVSSDINAMLSKPISVIRNSPTLDILEDNIRDEAAILRRRIVDSEGVISSEAAEILDRAEKSLEKAAEFGMPSASKLKADLQSARKKGKEISLMEEMMDREQLAGGGIGTQAQRAFVSPTGFMMQGSAALGKAKGTIKSSAALANPVSEAVNRIITLDPKDLVDLSNRTSNPLLKKYLRAMALMEAPKRKAAVFNIVQQPSLREDFNSFFGIDEVDLSVLDEEKSK